jgi:hypothetical protein
MNRVEVWRFHDLNVNTGVLGRLNGGVEQTTGFTFSPSFGNGVNRITPFLGRDRIWIGLCRSSSEPHGISPTVKGPW